MTPPVALTIAGSDPSGGAGLQADLKTFHQLGAYGTSVVTLITVQNTLGVSRVVTLDPDLVVAQIEAVIEDVPPLAAKTGALGSADVVARVAACVRRFDFPLVVDPVMRSKHGAPLIAQDAQALLVRELFPLARLVTPNAHEAQAITGRPVRDVPSALEAARRIADLGPAAVLVKGGHLDAEAEAVDVLYYDGEHVLLRGPRFDARHTHGTGCTYSAAIAAYLARGLGLADAVRHAKRWLGEALRTAFAIGHGTGPVNHFARES